LEGKELGIAAVERHQFRVRAKLSDSAVFDDCYLVCAPHCRESMGDVYCRPKERRGSGHQTQMEVVRVLRRTNLVLLPDSGWERRWIR